MKFGPLRYTNSAGVYEEDPEIHIVQTKLERALFGSVRRRVARIMAQKSWEFIKHGSMSHAMRLNVEFWVLDAEDIEKIKEDARREERARIRDKIMDVL